MQILIYCGNLVPKIPNFSLNTASPNMAQPSTMQLRTGAYQLKGVAKNNIFFAFFIIFRAKNSKSWKEKKLLKTAKKVF